MSEEPRITEARTPEAAHPTGLADGEWHRLHRATPLFRGGIALLAILGVIIANLRERLFEMFFPYVPGAEYEGDPIDFIVGEGLIGWTLLAVAVVIVLIVLGFWLSWRMHSFRVTDEVVEVRSGILFRTHRKARLDRVQGINIMRPLLPRLFGAAKLEVNQAGQDANVQLAYLAGGQADALRREILRLASGAQARSGGAGEVAGVASAEGVPGAGSPAARVGDLVEQRVHEFLAPELDDELATRESIVAMHPGRLLGSIVLSAGMIVLVLLGVGAAVVAILTGSIASMFFLVFPVIGVGTWMVQKFLRSLRYTIAGTPNGIRVGFGLLSTANETLPPGRIHAVHVGQSILWRGPGWFDIKINRAGSSSMKGAGGESNAVILPVGDLDDVLRVLALISPGLDPELLRAGILGTGAADDGFVCSPRRAAWFKLWAWRRNGVAVTDEAILLRRGRLYRELVIGMPARAQGVSMQQGPLLRLFSLADLQLHSVAGPISLQLGALDAIDTEALFERIAADAVAGAVRDRSHRWGAAPQGSGG